jgi:putative inorganic carbon (hco3(-)) transporter
MRAPPAQGRFARGVGTAVGAALLAAAAALLGIALVATSARFDDYGPIVLLCLVVVPLWMVATIMDPKWGVVAVFLTFPIGSITTPVGGLQLVELTLIGVAVVVGLARLGTGKAPLPWPTQMWWVLALVAWTFIALPSALDQYLALKQIAALIGAATFALIVVAACRDMRDVKIVLIALVAVAAGIAGGALLQGGDFQSTFGGTRVAGRAVSSFDHSNQLGSLSAMSVLITVGLLTGARSTRGRFFGSIALILLVTGQALTLSRGAWIGTVVGIAFLALILPHARRALIGFMLPVIAVSAIVFFVAPESTQIQVIGQRFESLTVRSPYDDRPAIWEEAIREIMDDPLTGQGPGNFPVASVTAGSGANSVFAYHAHNILLTWAAESGIPAALMVLGFAISLAAAVVRTTKARSRSDADVSDRAVLAGMAAALIALAAQGMVDFTLRNTVILYAVWAVIGCMLASIRIAAEEEEPVAEEPVSDRWWATYQT